MSALRRYDEDEVARILEAATEAQTSRPSPTGSGGGLTLPELQDIADEVGISRDLVARAAARIDRAEDAGRGGPLGVPLKVWRTVRLPRGLTDPEWEQLVAQLRRTFNARGRTESIGSLREWRNSNLRVSVDPTGEGYELSMQTRKGDFGPLLAAGSSVLIVAAVLFMVGLVAGDLDINVVLMLGFLGLAGVTANLVRLPIWSRTRARQMEEIAATVAEWTALPPPIDDEDS